MALSRITTATITQTILWSTAVVSIPVAAAEYHPTTPYTHSPAPYQAPQYQAAQQPLVTPPEGQLYYDPATDHARIRSSAQEQSFHPAAVTPVPTPDTEYQSTQPYTSSYNMASSDAYRSYQSPSSLNEIRQGEARFITGGIGDGETAQLRSRAGEYNTHITNAEANGAYVGEVMLQLTDQQGQEVIGTNAGPLFYAELPKGTYNLTASYQGQTQTKRFTVGQNTSANVMLRW